MRIFGLVFLSIGLIGGNLLASDMKDDSSSDQKKNEKAEPEDFSEVLEKLQEIDKEKNNDFIAKARYLNQVTSPPSEASSSNNSFSKALDGVEEIGKRKHDEENGEKKKLEEFVKRARYLSEVSLPVSLKYDLDDSSEEELEGS